MSTTTVMTVTLTKELIKAQAYTLRENLHEKLSQSAAYNLVAKMYGFKDWNTLIAMIKGIA